MPYIFRLNSEPEGVVVNLRVDDAWSPTVSYDGSDVVESIPCVFEALTDDAQAANLQALHRIQENVRYYVEEPSSLITQETWLEWAMAGESDADVPRRRLVKAMDVAFDSGVWFNCGAGNISNDVRAVLTLRCSGWWEVDAQGGGAFLANPLMEYQVVTQPGDAPGRLSRILILADSGNTIGAYVAFRSEKRHGDLDNFVPVWELEDGTALLDTAPAIEAGGSPSDLANNCQATDFNVSAAMLPRVNIMLSDVTVNYEENYGRFVVLYRGKVDAGASCTVRVDYSPGLDLPWSPTALQGTEFTVSLSALWGVYNTGLIIQMPRVGTRSFNTVNRLGADYGFVINASMETGTTGTDNLYSDCLILIPIDEYLLYYQPDETITPALGDTLSTYFFVGPDGSATVTIEGAPSSNVYDAGIPYITGDGVPIEDDLEVRAYFMLYSGQGFDGTNAMSDDADSQIFSAARYHSVQGAG